MISKIDFSKPEGALFEGMSFEAPEGVHVDTDQQIEELLHLADELAKNRKYAGYNKWFIPGTPFGIENLPKHKAFFDATANYSEVYLSGSNRSSKTVSGAMMTARHLTGEYPDWWEGRKFDKPTDGWAMGDSKETVRDIITRELLGDQGSLGTGMIPADKIEKVVYRPNSGGAVDYILVRHVSGGLSRLGFKSYEQGIESFYGTKKDFIWADELPPENIYSECYIRTMTTNGIIYITATPLAGLTNLVVNFYNNADFLPLGSEIPGIVALSREDAKEKLEKKIQEGEADLADLETSNKKISKAVVIISWSDALWLTEEAKERMLAGCPAHLREARSKGLPSMGSGSVFTIPLEQILVPDFEIPKHWKHIGGLDVGWNNTGAVWIAENPDTGECFIYSDYKKGQAEPLIHAEALKLRGSWIPLEIDPASRASGQADGRRLFNLYRQMGLKLVAADNAREASLYELQEAFATGKLKMFKSLMNLAKEYVTYRRDERGRIIKENDHCLVYDTVVYTDKGPSKIGDLVGTEGRVLSAGGVFLPYQNCRKTQRDTPIVEVEFEDGSTVTCTPDHQFWTEQGWVKAIDCLGYACYNTLPKPEGEVACLDQKLSVQPAKTSLEPSITSVDRTSSHKESASTVSSTSTITEKSPRDTTSTTLTTTRPTIIQKILSWFTVPSTCLTTKKATQEHQQHTPTKRPLSGTGQKKARTGTSSTTRTSSTCFTGELIENAPCAAQSTTLDKQTCRSLPTAQTNAGHKQDGTLVSMTSKRHALSVLQSSPLTSTQDMLLAQDSAVRWLQVKSVRPKGKADVYCLEVPESNSFVVNGGAVVHNCIDALRYAWMGRKHARQKPISQHLAQGGAAIGAPKRYDI